MGERAVRKIVPRQSPDLRKKVAGRCRQSAHLHCRWESRLDVTRFCNRYRGGAAAVFAAAGLEDPANGGSGEAMIFESTGLSPSTAWILASCGLCSVSCEPIVRTACGASA